MFTMIQQAQRVTIKDVADVAGVSVATVSKVINGRYGVAAATSERVMEIISELGYESSLVARGLRSHRTNVIGILVAEFEPFSTQILQGVSNAIAATGFELLAYSAGGDGSPAVGWEKRYLSRLSGTLIDGAILECSSKSLCESEDQVGRRGRRGWPSRRDDGSDGAGGAARAGRARPRPGPVTVQASSAATSAVAANRRPVWKGSSSRTCRRAFE